MSKSEKLEQSIDKEYRLYIKELKNRIRSAQLKATYAVNAELTKLYWEIGNSVIEKQKQAKWGSGFIVNLARDLQSEFPGMSGFSAVNLKRMRQFAENYPGGVIGSQPVTQLPWGHIQVLMFQVKDKSVREWYASQALENGWSRSVLSMQIKTDLYERQGRLESKTSNFRANLPPLQSDLAEQALKDPYVFDFLTVGKDAHEREIEKLKDMSNPMGISEYQLTRMMPQNLKTSLPTIEEIEAELSDMD